MHEDVFQRHDLVWLAPQWPLADLALPPAERVFAAGWIARHLPFVVARQDAAVPGVRIGFTLPGTGPRRRIGLHVPHAAIVRHEPAPLLEHLLARAPLHWQDGLAVLLREFSKAGLAPRVFGSLVNEAHSGEPCLRSESDLDLLVACSGQADVWSALDILRRHGQHAPRIDAELRLRGRAASWRELEQVLAGSGTDRRVLVKSDTDTHLVALEDFLEGGT